MLLTYTYQRQKKKTEEKLREECMEEALMLCCFFLVNMTVLLGIWETLSEELPPFNWSVDHYIN